MTLNGRRRSCVPFLWRPARRNKIPYVRINTAMAVNKIYSQPPWFPAEHDKHQCKKGWRYLCVHTVRKKTTGGAHCTKGFRMFLASGPA